MAFTMAAALSLNAYAAFPDDFESGVILVEETFEDGNARRALGFNDGGIEGNVPGIREFLNNATVDDSLQVVVGRIDARFGQELDFVHDERGVWPNGPNNDGLNTVNGVVWAFTQLPDSDLWAGGTFEFIRFQPLQNFRVVPGQILGFMVSGITRNGIEGRNNIQARTNVAFFEVGDGPRLNNGTVQLPPVGGRQLTDEEVEELFSGSSANGPANILPAVDLLLNQETED